MVLKLPSARELQGPLWIGNGQRAGIYPNVCGSYADASPVSGTSSLIILIEADPAVV